MKIRITSYFGSAAIAAALLCSLTVLARADTITVTNTNDSGPGSLRQALADANDGDTIDFNLTYPSTITLTSGELIVFGKSITISGPGANHLTVDGNAQSGVFYVNSGDGKNVTIDGLTIANGFSNYGGGIINDGSDQAGAVRLTITNCTVSGNSARIAGGGILTGAVNGGATLTITNSTLSGNSAGVSGGGIFSGAGASSPFFSMVTISNSTISGNSAGDGGGIYNNGAGSASATLIVSNSTLSGNSAGDGGGIYNNGTGSASTALTVSNSTLSGNSATGNGGGIYNYEGDFSAATLNLSSTILNTGGLGENIFNIGGTVTSHGYNLSSDDGGGYLTVPGDEINTNPLLGPLQDNGGPTLTHRPSTGSPAIDAGDPTFNPPPFYDQRGPGFDRVVNGRIDIGSFEVQAGKPPVRPPPTSRPRPTPRPRP